MPFDTITRLPDTTGAIAEQQPQIWAFHAEKISLSQKIATGPFSVPIYFAKNIYVKPAGLTAMAATFSAITIFSVFSPSFVTGKTNASVKGALDRAPQEEMQAGPSGGIPAKVNFQGKEIEGFSPIALEAKPMDIRVVPRAIKSGGFESIYLEAGNKFGVPWQVIAAVHYVETGQSGDTQAVSSAGALGPMQFMQPTFNAYQQDGDNDGVKNVSDVHDAIFTAAKQLAANGASQGNVRQALYNYNHSNAYVEKVLSYAAGMGYYI